MSAASSMYYEEPHAQRRVIQIKLLNIHKVKYIIINKLYVRILVNIKIISQEFQPNTSLFADTSWYDDGSVPEEIGAMSSLLVDKHDVSERLAPLKDSLGMFAEMQNLRS